MKLLARLVSICIVAAVFTAAASAQSDAADLPGPAQHFETESGWEISVAPFYGWIAGIDGSLAAFGSQRVDIDVTPLDLIENIDDVIESLDFAIMAAAEVRKDRFGVFTDLVYYQISTDEATPGPLFSGVEVTDELLVFTALGSYRIFDSEAAHLDALAGIRVWSVDLNLDFDAGVLPAANFSDGATWVDPVVGVKGRVSLTEHLYLTSWAMIGGFGASSDSSDFMWDLFGAVGYEVRDWLSLVAGFRATHVDFEQDGFVYDVTFYGPLVGAVVRF